jgi:hypothetical protein
MHNHLDRLTMQCELSFGCLLQFVASGPCGMIHSGLLVDLTTEVPDFRRFHLSSFQASKQLWMRLQLIDVYRVHCRLLAFLLFLDVFLYGSQDLSIERAIILFCYLSNLFQKVVLPRF